MKKKTAKATPINAEQIAKATNPNDAVELHERKTDAQETPATTPAVKLAKSHTEFLESLAAMSPDSKEALLSLAKTSANVIAGTVGQQKHDKDGNPLVSKIGRKIPAYTPPRGAVEGITATDVQERLQIQRAFDAGRWPKVARERAEKLFASKGRKLTATEIDRCFAQSDVPKAWQPNGKERKRPAYQRVLATVVSDLIADVADTSGNN